MASIENRAVRGLNIPRHRSSNEVYNEYTDLTGCESTMNALNTCLTNTQYKSGQPVNNSCLELLENVKHSCGLRRPAYVTNILTRHTEI